MQGIHTDTKDALLVVLVAVLVALVARGGGEGEPFVGDGGDGTYEVNDTDHIVVTGGDGGERRVKVRDLVDRAVAQVDSAADAQSLDDEVARVTTHAAAHAGQEARATTYVEEQIAALRSATTPKLEQCMIADESYKMLARFNFGHAVMALSDEKCDSNSGGGDDEARWCHLHRPHVTLKPRQRL